jgi:hypothetical protein
LAIHNATILAAENRKLRAANKKIKKKKAKKKAYVSKKSVLSVAKVHGDPENQIEAQFRAEIASQEIIQEAIQVIQQPEIKVAKRTPPTCSLCNTVGHTSRSCSTK